MPKVNFTKGILAMALLSSFLIINTTALESNIALALSIALFSIGGYLAYKSATESFGELWFLFFTGVGGVLVSLAKFNLLVFGEVEMFGTTLSNLATGYLIIFIIVVSLPLISQIKRSW